jgi:SAM-dependent methyltransferase
LARELYGISLTYGGITEMTPEAELGIVVLWQVLAHIPDPLEALRCAARMLRPDGTLLVTCIHWDDPHYRLARLLAQWKKVNAIHIPTILWRFRREHLEELARRAHLRVQSFEYGFRAFREPFGWKRQVLECGFAAYRRVTKTGEEMRGWLRPCLDVRRNLLPESSIKLETQNVVSQTAFMLCGEKTQ